MKKTSEREIKRTIVFIKASKDKIFTENFYQGGIISVLKNCQRLIKKLKRTHKYKGVLYSWIARINI